MQLVNMQLSDPFTQTWMKLYIYMLKKNLALIKTFLQTHKKEFTSIAEYQAVCNDFLEKQHDNPMVSAVNRVLSCDVIILQIFPFEPLSLIMRYTQLL